MKYDPYGHGMPCPNRRSIRLQGYDYTQPGAYFITIVTQDRECLFGEVADGEMRLNEAGRVVEQCWLAIPDHFPRAALDAFVVMPNHIHGIVWIVGARHAVPLPGDVPIPTEQFGKPIPGSIPTIIRSFKSATTKRINEYRQTPGLPVWQRNYYEHIIRDDDELNRIRKYIANNPLQWALDRENPDIVIPMGQPQGVAPTKDEPWRI